MMLAFNLLYCPLILFALFTCEQFYIIYQTLLHGRIIIYDHNPRPYWVDFSPHTYGL